MMNIQQTMSYDFRCYMRNVGPYPLRIYVTSMAFSQNELLYISNLPRTVEHLQQIPFRKQHKPQSKLILHEEDR